jgi:hypothetical protein
MNVPRQVALGTAAIAALVLSSAGVGVGYVAGEHHEHDTSAVAVYTATVRSLYPDGTGGCLRPAAGSGLAEAGPEGSCGPFFWQSGVTRVVGEKVEVVEVRGHGPQDEDLWSFLLSPTP